MERFKVALISGLKAFVISGLASAVVLLNAGFGAKDIKEISIALLIAFVTGGVKGIEKAYNFIPQQP
jgi:hypothetical protein